MIGVGFVTGTLVLGATMNKAFYASFAAGARNVDAAVSPAAAKTDLRPGAPGAPSIPGTVLDRIGQVPGVAAVAGRVVGEAALLGPDGKVITSGPRPGAGINVPSDPALRGFTVVSGRLPASPAEALVDTSTATDEHFRVGHSIRVVDSTGTVRAFRLVGTIDLGVNHSLGDAAVVAFQTATALSVTGRPGYDQVVARAAPGVSQATLVSRIRALPGLPRYQVQTGSQLATSQASAAVHFTRQFTTAILVFALVSLVVAAIVIANTFRILAAQRTRELALLRCVGATRRQVFAGMLMEALGTGAAASAAGVPRHHQFAVAVGDRADQGIGPAPRARPDARRAAPDAAHRGPADGAAWGCARERVRLGDGPRVQFLRRRRRDLHPLSADRPLRCPGSSRWAGGGGAAGAAGGQSLGCGGHGGRLRPAAHHSAGGRRGFLAAARRSDQPSAARAHTGISHQAFSRAT